MRKLCVLALALALWACGPVSVPTPHPTPYRTTAAKSYMSLSVVLAKPKETVTNVFPYAREQSGILNDLIYVKLRKGAKDPGGFSTYQQVAVTGVGNSFPAKTKLPVVKGDLLMVTAYYALSSGSAAAPTGWTAWPVRNCTGLSLQSFTKVATSSEPLTYTFTLPSTVAFSAALREINGIFAATPVDKEASQCDASSTTLATPSLTPTGNPDWALSSFAIGNVTAVTTAPAAGWVEDFESFNPTASMEGQENSVIGTSAVSNTVTLGTATAGIGEEFLLNTAPLAPTHVLTMDSGSGLINTYPPLMLQYLSFEEASSKTLTPTETTYLNAGVKTVLYESPGIAIDNSPVGSVMNTYYNSLLPLTSGNFDLTCAGSTQAKPASFPHQVIINPAGPSVPSAINAAMVTPNLPYSSYPIDFWFFDAPVLRGDALEVSTDTTQPACNGTGSAEPQSFFDISNQSLFNTLALTVPWWINGAGGAFNLSTSVPNSSIATILASSASGDRSEGDYTNPAYTLGAYKYYVYNNTALNQYAWSGAENIEIAFANANKYLELQTSGTIVGSGITPTSATGITLRKYGYASFLLTYNLNYSINWQMGFCNQCVTPSNPYCSTANVCAGKLYPEQQFVCINPTVPEPANATGLTTGVATLKANGSYYREYLSCFYNGTRMGSGIVAINPDASVTNNFPGCPTGLAASCGSGGIGNYSSTNANAETMTLNNGTGANAFCTVGTPTPHGTGQPETCTGAEIENGGFLTFPGGTPCPAVLTPGEAEICIDPTR